MNNEAHAPPTASTPPTPPAGAPAPAPAPAPLDRLLSGVRGFQRHTAPLVRDRLAVLARDGQAPSQLFVACADSRMVTSMITGTGPGELFTVRNVGNLVPRPQRSRTTQDPPSDPADDQTGGNTNGHPDGHPGDPADDSVAAAVEYALGVLKVDTVTVCGHSGCGGMQGLLRGAHLPSGEPTPLGRWLRNGQDSLTRLHRSPARFADREADELERLCLTNVVQQLENLAAHPAVRARAAEGPGAAVHLVGMYFDIATAQAYLLDPASGLFAPVGAETAGTAA